MAYKGSGLGLKEPGANTSAHVSKAKAIKNQSASGNYTGTGQLDSVIGQGPDAAYQQFVKNRAALATQVAQQKAQQQKNQATQQKVMTTNAKIAAPTTNPNDPNARTPAAPKPNAPATPEGHGIMHTLGAYGKALVTSPVAAVKDVITGQGIKDVNNGAIIVNRMPATASENIKRQQGKANPNFKLDHTQSLEIGGDNNPKNLKAVPTQAWANYTPVEDYLGSQLKANVINAQQAKDLMTQFKSGKMSAQTVYQKAAKGGLPAAPSLASKVAGAIDTGAKDISNVGESAVKSTVQLPVQVAKGLGQEANSIIHPPAPVQVNGMSVAQAQVKAQQILKTNKFSAATKQLIATGKLPAQPGGKPGAKPTDQVNHGNLDTALIRAVTDPKATDASIQATVLAAKQAQKTEGNQVLGGVVQAAGLGIPETKVLGTAAEKLAPNVAEKVAAATTARSLPGAATKAVVTGGKLAPSGAVIGAGQGISEGKSPAGIAKSAIETAAVAGAGGALGSGLHSIYRGATTKGEPVPPIETTLHEHIANASVPAEKELAALHPAPTGKEPVMPEAPTHPLGINPATDPRFNKSADPHAALQDTIDAHTEYKQMLASAKAPEVKASIQKQITSLEEKVPELKGPAASTELPTVSKPTIAETKPQVPQGEEGFVSPGAAHEDLKAMLKETRKGTAAAGPLADKLEALKGNNTADRIAVQKYLQATKNLKQEDLTGAYHYAEDRSFPVTDAQKEIFTKYVDPLIKERDAALARLKEQSVPMGDREGIHRIAQNKGGALEQFIRGESHEPVGGGFLKKTTDSMKTRTMKAITDEQGTRSVVAIKTPKDELGKAMGAKRVTAMNKSGAVDLGTLRLKSKEDLLEKEAKPLKTTLGSLQKQYKALETIKATGGVLNGRFNALAHKVALLEDARNFDGLSKPELKSLREATLKLKELTKVREATSNAPLKLDKIGQQINIVQKNIDDVASKYNPSELNDKVFTGNNGKRYTVGEATTKEIEANTKVRYYKNPVVNTAIDYLQTRSAERANQFLNEWKTSPEFKYNPETGQGIAIKDGEGVIPKDWKTTKAPQFVGYHFSPRVAEVLDDFAGRSHEDPLAALNATNRFLRTTIFFNPLIHIPNVATHWVMNRGASSIINPMAYKRLATTGVKAIDEVVHQGPMFTDMLRSGAPLMSFDQEKFSGAILHQMEDEMKSAGIGQHVADALGYASPAKLLKVWYGFSHKSTWVSNDIMTMQAIMDEMGKGRTMQEAIAKVGDHIPNYRMPARIAGSRPLKQLISNPNLTMFASYHYGVLKNYATLVRDLVGKTPGIKDRAGAVDKMLMGALVALVAYPEMDKLAQKLTGNQSAMLRRSGPFALPQAIKDVHSGKKTFQQGAEGFVTPAPGTRGLSELYHNKDYFGNQIYDPNDIHHPGQLGKDIGNFAASLIAPVAAGQKIAKGQGNAGKFVAGLFGISFPQTTLDNKINALVKTQYGDAGMTVQQKRVASAKAKARDQIASGHGNALAKQLVANGTIAANKLAAFEAGAKMTAQQRAFDSLNYVNKAKILAAAKPSDIATLTTNTHALQVEAAGALHSKTSTDQTKAAARQILQKLGGNSDTLYKEYKAARSAKSKATRAKHKK